MVAVHGKAHTRVRSFVTNAINRPDALNRIAALVQPRMVIALRSWAQMGKINARFETQKVFIYILIYIKLIIILVSAIKVLESKSINFNIH
jgi:hypothetical protein